jgi:hypothetical protein
MDDPIQELLSIGRQLGYQSRHGPEHRVSDTRRIMHGVDTTKEVTELSREYYKLCEYNSAKSLVDIRLVEERTSSLEQAAHTMQGILDNKSKLVERFRATKMSGTIPVQQEHQRDLQRLLEACAADLHSTDQGANAVDWAVNFKEPTSIWEERTRAVTEATSALQTLQAQETERSKRMEELVRDMRRR